MSPQHYSIYGLPYLKKILQEVKSELKKQKLEDVPIVRSVCCLMVNFLSRKCVLCLLSKNVFLLWLLKSCVFVVEVLTLARTDSLREGCTPRFGGLEGGGIRCGGS